LAAEVRERWHFLFPSVTRFCDPIRSPIPSNLQRNLQHRNSPPAGVSYDLWQPNPANFGRYDNALWTWDTYRNWSATWPAR